MKLLLFPVDPTGPLAQGANQLTRTIKMRELVISEGGSFPDSIFDELLRPRCPEKVLALDLKFARDVQQN